MRIPEGRDFWLVNVGTIAAGIPIGLAEQKRFYQRAEFDPQTISDIQSNPLLYAYYFNSGDLINSLGVAGLMGMVLDLQFPRVPERIKDGVCLATGTLAVAIVELTSFLNHGEVSDIPAGFAGGLIYAGIRHFVRERSISREVASAEVKISLS